MAAKSYEDMLNTISDMSVLELADFVKAIEDKFGVTAAMPVMAASAAGASAETAKAEEKTQFKVTLTNVGDKKIEVIKALRKAIANLGLTEAKNFVENAPSVIAEAASKEDAQKMKETLEAAGAKVELS